MACAKRARYVIAFLSLQKKVGDVTELGGTKDATRSKKERKKKKEAADRPRFYFSTT